LSLFFKTKTLSKFIAISKIPKSTKNAKKANQNPQKMQKRQTLEKEFALFKNDITTN